MSDPLNGPTDEERAVYIDSGEWVDSDWEIGTKVGGSVSVSFDHFEVDDLLRAADLTGERSTAFIKHAAMERIAEVLAEHSETPTAQAQAAGGS